MIKLNDLSSEEVRVIKEKGTETPFSGKFNEHKVEGIYICRQCGAFLYRSDSKFDSGCGWPSFDDSVYGAVHRDLDTDGMRTEITCKRCGAHLGHVFEGEQLTDKNTRHCVNSVSMDFISSEKFNQDTERDEIILGGGCFWCIEAALKMITGVSGVVSGYAGGEKENPTYEEVSSGDTGHAEVVKVSFDPKQVSLEKILNIYFESHDPTTLNRQGNDVGTQYRSIICAKDKNQFDIVENFIDKIRHDYSDPVVTELKIDTVFYPAEDYHKDYFKNHPENNYCQLVIAPKIEKIKKKLNK